MAFSMFGVARAAEAGGGASGESDPRIARASISFRISPMQWMPEKRFSELMELFERHKGVTDEIAFFSSHTHAPLPLEVIKQRCGLLAERMKQARARGYRAGINVLATMGHHDENLDNSLGGEYGGVRDIEGNVCRGAICPNDPRLLEYVRELYRTVAAAGPDYIWVDDDVRLAGHMPLGLTCFCDNCLAIFEKECGTKYTRDSFAKAVDESRLEQRLAVRKAWLAHNRATIARLLAVVERAVHEVRPGLPLGFMSGDRFHEGYDFAGWTAALAGPSGAAVYWRPGGGFYEDSTTSGLIGKSHGIGRQVALIPSSVVCIQSEIENFPYHLLKKSRHITTLEAAAHIGAGCTGAAFNVLADTGGPFDEYEPLVAQIQQSRPFYDRLAKAVGRTPPRGVFIAWNQDTAAAATENAGRWFAFGALSYLNQASQLLELGLPAAYSLDSAAATVLSWQAASTLSEAELMKVLSTGVYMDGEALQVLNDRGYQTLTGLAVERTLPADCIEKLTEHALNGAYAGRLRDCRQSFNHMSAHALKKVDPRAKTLARLVDYGGREVAACGMAVYENRLGGRVCVGGYFPWTLIHNRAKSEQLKSVLRWLSHEELPAYVASFHKVNLWARPLGDGRMSIVMLNASFDPSDGLVLATRNISKKINIIDIGREGVSVAESSDDGRYRRFTLPPMMPWTARLVTAE